MFKYFHSFWISKVYLFSVVALAMSPDNKLYMNTNVFTVACTIN